jgi:hypothetical protein
MSHGLRSPLLIVASLVVGFTAPAARAVVILPSFDSSITTLSNAAAVENAITTAINAMDSLYNNPGTVQVLFQFDAGLGGGASTNSSIVSTSYSGYVSALQNDLAAHPGNATLATAVAHLPTAPTLTTDFGSVPDISVTGPFANLILGTGKFLCFNSSGSFINGCNASTAGSYESVVAISSTAVAPIEHELDEVIGGGGPGTTLTDISTGEPATLGPLDLYRYRSTGAGCTTASGLTQTLSWTDSSSAVACLSIDGGHTAFAQFNQVGGGSDYGDFAAPVPAIQDAFESGTPPPYTTASPEFEMMESIGYDTPEPATIGLFVTALAGLGWLRRRGGGDQRANLRI